MGDIDPSTAHAKYAKALVSLDLGVDDSWAMYGRNTLVRSLEELLTLRAGMGPGNTTLNSIFVRTETPSAMAPLLDKMRLDYTLYHMPRRGDAIERWLEKFCRESYTGGAVQAGVRYLLDQYRMKADAGEVLGNG